VKSCGVSTNCIDPRTRLLSNHSEVVNFAADVLAYNSYCIRLMLLGITASEEYLMPVTYK